MAERILVVDDEIQITRVLRASLSAQRYDVRTANDPEEALRIFEEWDPDLVVTDLMMPGMTGVELCRASAAKPARRFVVLSVRDQEHAKVEALDAGADDYVTKPFSIQELLARIRAHLRRAPERSEDGPVRGRRLSRRSRCPHSHRLRPRRAPHAQGIRLSAALRAQCRQGLTHRVLLTNVWGAQSAQQPEYLRVFVGQLRKKLQGKTQKEYIQTEPWVGYRFLPEGEIRIAFRLAAAMIGIFMNP